VDLSCFILEKPNFALTTGEKAIINLVPPDILELHDDMKIHLRILSLPEKTKLPQISEKHLGKLICVEGILRKITEIYLTLKDAVFKCMRCGSIIKIHQELEMGTTKMLTPLECSKEQGGCGRMESSTTFKLLKEDSIYVDTEKVEIQDIPEGVLGAKIERKIGYLFDDITGKLQPGDRIVLNGIVRAKPQFRGGNQTTEFKLLLQGISLEVLDRAYEQIEITDTDILRIKTEAQNPEVFNHLVSSIAPSVYGQYFPKLAISHVLFGGSERLLPDGTKKRGDIHLLMVGDPGVAKTQILKAVAELSPRGMYVQGKQVTAAGLTAACVRDEFGEGRWSLEAGAMVLADKGTLCISDFQNMNENDRTAMHDALEQQVISIAKAGITAELKSRCSVLADANPKGGRWSDFSPIADQINISPPLLSRFDIIFVIKDKPEMARDDAIAQHILGTFSGSALDECIQCKPYFDKKFLQKYIAYAKSLNPKLEENGDAFKTLKNFYLQTRNDARALEQGVVTATARQLDGLVRLAFASARIRLSEIVEVEDAKRSIEIIHQFMKGFVDEEGTFDIDMIAAGTSHSQRDMIFDLMTIIQALQDGSGKKIAKLSDILDETESRAYYDRTRIITALEKMVTHGYLYHPTSNKNEFRVV